MKLQRIIIAAASFAALATPAFGQITYISQNRRVYANWHVESCLTTAPNFAPFNASCQQNEFSSSQSSTLGPSTIAAHIEIAGPANSGIGTSDSTCSATFRIDTAVSYTISVSGSGQFFSGANLTGNGVSVQVLNGTQTGLLLPGEYTFGGGACCSTAIEDFSLTVTPIPYTMDWSTIDCGGGLTSGDSLILSGTIGQHDATSVLTGGTFTLTGGFWFDLTPPCFADFNHDSVVDFNDYLDFVDALSTAVPEADFNHDSVIDFNDYLDFVDALSVGC